MQGAHPPELQGGLRLCMLIFRVTNRQSNKVMLRRRTFKILLECHFLNPELYLPPTVSCCKAQLSQTPHTCSAQGKTPDTGTLGLSIQNASQLVLPTRGHGPSSAPLSPHHHPPFLGSFTPTGNKILFLHAQKKS